MDRSVLVNRLGKLVVIVGPTAVGKTEIALKLAQKLDGEIISADSRLFYRGMDIGTAKPDLDEQSLVPHHLIDVAEPDQVWSLGMFQAEARRVIAQIQARQRLPLLVGGTGQYIRAVTQGWQPPEVEPDAKLRLVLEEWAEEIGSMELHQRLGTLDPSAAKTIDYRNLRRTIRALEVIFTTGRLFSEQRRHQPSVYNQLTIGLRRERQELYRRIDERIDRMISDGLVKEVQLLLDAGYSPSLPSMSAIGYRQVAACLAGGMSLEEAIQEIRRKTRIFVRRQANWFKADDPAIHWFEADKDAEDHIESCIRDWLGDST